MFIGIGEQPICWISFEVDQLSNMLLKNAMFAVCWVYCAIRSTRLWIVFAEMSAKKLRKSVCCL